MKIDATGGQSQTTKETNVLGHSWSRRWKARRHGREDHGREAQQKNLNVNHLCAAELDVASQRHNGLRMPRQPHVAAYWIPAHAPGVGHSPKMRSVKPKPGEHIYCPKKRKNGRATLPAQGGLGQHARGHITREGHTPNRRGRTGFAERLCARVETPPNHNGNAHGQMQVLLTFDCSGHIRQEDKHIMGNWRANRNNPLPRTARVAKLRSIDERSGFLCKLMAERGGGVQAAAHATLHYARTTATGGPLAAEQKRQASGATAHAHTEIPKTIPNPTHLFDLLCRRRAAAQHETPHPASPRGRARC